MSVSAPFQGMEALTAAMSVNIVPDQEYLLQGSVMDSHVDVLNHRLRGLCDNVDIGQETFHEKELVFSIRGTTSQPLTLRVRHSLEPNSSIPWQLRYIGQPELGNRATVVRSCYDIACSSNIIDFLTELGCRLEFEYVSKGFLYRKGLIKVSVSKVFKAGEGTEPISSSHLVELSMLAPSGNDGVADDMKTFADQLQPLVSLDKHDMRRA
jgi:mediator of RNA polymerase II transcription subunit 18